MKWTLTFFDRLLWPMRENRFLVRKRKVVSSSYFIDIFRIQFDNTIYNSNEKLVPNYICAMSFLFSLRLLCYSLSFKYKSYEFINRQTLYIFNNNNTKLYFDTFNVIFHFGMTDFHDRLFCFWCLHYLRRKPNSVNHLIFDLFIFSLIKFIIFWNYLCLGNFANRKI